MRRVVVLTGSELRHDYFRLRLARMPGIAVLRTYCEGREKSLQALAAKKCAELELWHLAAREQSERDFFELYVREVDDRSNHVFVEKGAINAPGVAEVSTFRVAATDTPSSITWHERQSTPSLRAWRRGATRSPTPVTWIGIGAWQSMHSVCRKPCERACTMGSVHAMPW